MLFVATALAFDVSEPACTGSRTTFTSTLAEAESWSWAINGVYASDEPTVDWVFAAAGTYPATLDMETPGGDVQEALEVEVFVPPSVTLGGPVQVLIHEQSDYLATGPDDVVYTWAVEGGTLLGDTSGAAVVVEWGESALGRIEVSGKTDSPCPGVEHLDVTIHPPTEDSGGEQDSGAVDATGCGCDSRGGVGGAFVGVVAALAAWGRSPVRGAGRRAAGRPG